MRSEFEKTRTFKSIYSTLMYFDEDLDLYTSKEKWREEDAWRLTYAWWAYKELQTQIDSKKETTKEGFAQWFKTTSYFGAYFTDFDITLNHRDQFENDIINSAWLAYQNRQTEVDELQKQLIDRGQRFNEQAQRVKDLEHKSAELQKRVDAVQRLIESWNMTNFDKSTHFNDGYEEGCFNCARELEQVLKGGGDENQ